MPGEKLCPRLFELVRFHAGDLPEIQAMAIKQHLDGCERCRKIIEEMELQRREFLAEHSAEEVVPRLMEKAKPKARRGLLRRACWKIRDWTDRYF